MLQLHAQTIPPQLRHQEIFRAFDELTPGASFVLVNNHAPWPLLRQFQVLRANAFEWSVLEAGPVTFRVEIQKLVEPAQRGVQAFLGADHLRLDALLAQARATSGEPRLEAFRAFAVGLTRHMEMEERELFPTFERVSGAAGPVAVMNQEHQAFRAALRDCSDPGRADFEQWAGHLETALGAHNRKEERIIYPTTDAKLSDSERAGLVLAMQGCDA
jgi:uncharacterized protein (DUF2249 family)/hemerythrin superfamily protein